MSSKKKKDKDDKISKEAEVQTDPQAEDASQTEETHSDTETSSRQAEKIEERLLRLQADFDNFRKRTQRERAEWYLQANEDIFIELLPVMDHFEMGIKNAVDHRTDQAVIDGLQMIYEQMNAVFKKFKLTPIDAEGEAFDPHLHEAITILPSEDHPHNSVITQTRRGYKLGDKLLRAPQVVVSEHPDHADEEEQH